MDKILSVAVLGSTGYVGLELVKILHNHPNVKINFLGCENPKNLSVNFFDEIRLNQNLPNLKLNNSFDPSNSDVLFLALPHGASHSYVKKFNNKIKIIDLSADFRLDSLDLYKLNYNENHSCPEFLNSFVYGLPTQLMDVIPKIHQPCLCTISLWIVQYLMYYST